MNLGIMRRAETLPPVKTSQETKTLLSNPTKDDGSQLELGDDEQAVALRKAWEKTLRTLVNKVSKSSYESFFLPTQPVSIDEDTVVLGAPSAFAREWLEKRYREQIRSLMMQNLGRTSLHLRFVRTNSEVRGVVTERTPSQKDDRNHTAAPSPATALKEGDELVLEPPSAKKPTRKRETSAAISEIPADMSQPLNEKYTFDNLVVGDSNRLAHMAAARIVETPGKIFNPLFIHGNTGLGKTHIMHAIGHELRKAWPNLRIALVSGESFTNSYITALQHKKVDAFREVFRNIDVWLVDDIQALAGKEHTKEEFFHTFNTLHQAGKAVVLTSDQSPRELRTMDERLRTRFECGLIADVSPPELEMRIDILQKKALLEDLRIPTEVLQYMANLIQSNIRALEGALIKIMAVASMSKIPVTKELANNVLGSYFVEQRPVVAHSIFEHSERVRGSSPLVALPLPPVIINLDTPRGGKPLFDHVVESVARHYQLDPHLLAGSGSVIASRRREVAPARQMAIYLAREKTTLAVTELARLFGGISHGAVSHAHKKLSKQLETDPRTAKTIAEIAEKL
jgi:chromosomal replication initiator protein